MNIRPLTTAVVVTLQALSSAYGATISAPLLVTEEDNSRIQYFNYATQEINTIYSQTGARFNAAAVDTVNQNLYFFKIKNAANGTDYNELWRMDLSSGVYNDTTAGASNLNYSKLTMLGQFDLGAAGNSDDLPILGASFHNNHLLLTGSSATQIWAISTSTLDAAASTQRLVSTSNAFTAADWAATQLTFPALGTSMQPGDISIALDSSSATRIWFTGNGAGGAFAGAGAASWAAGDLNYTVGTTTSTAAALSNTSLPTARPGSTFDPVTGKSYAFEKATGNFFEINSDTAVAGTLIVDGTGVADGSGFKVFGDLTTFTSLTVIPEPSAGLLGLMGGLALLRRRR